MELIYVVDTNVLLADPHAIQALSATAHVVIPLAVIEELDKQKSDDNRDISRNAREVSRYLSSLLDLGDISQGVKVESGATVAVPMDDGKNVGTADERIIATSVWYTKAQASARSKKKRKVVLLSNDINVRIRAKASGVSAQGYERGVREDPKGYTGWREESCDPLLIDEMYAEGGLEEIAFAEPANQNEYVLWTSGSKSALTRVVGRDVRLVRGQDAFGLKPRNLEQRFALDALLDDEIKLVTLVGKAGCGKTLLALAAGLQKAVEDGTYAKVEVYRPVVSVGDHQLGFLPGSLEEKLAPWTAPIRDNVDLLMGNSKKKKSGGGFDELVFMEKLGIGAIEHIRGRSIPNHYIIIDEAQNLTLLDVKTIITRAGEGTKIVLTGDPGQIDTPKLNAHNNGLTRVAEAFRGQKRAAHITFSKSERSELAEIAASIL